VRSARHPAIHLAALLGCALVGAGCSGGVLPSPFATDPGVDAASLPRSDFLKLGRLRWSRGDETAVLLEENGFLRDRGALLGTVRADGSFTTLDEKTTLVMRPDGTVHVVTGFDVEIAADGTATTRVHGQPDETVTLESVGKPRGGRPGLTIEGLSPALRRTAMWILMIPDLLRVRADAGD
jgi:hypothetical protein